MSKSLYYIKIKPHNYLITLNGFMFKLYIDFRNNKKYISAWID